MPQPPTSPRIIVPVPPAAPVPYSFPLVATLAPVGMSVVIFVITQSPLALIFSALGPVIAVGSLVDSRAQAKRRLRRERERFAQELTSAQAAIDLAQRAERAEMVAAYPASYGAPAHSVRGEPPAVRVGIGIRVSASAFRPESLAAAGGTMDSALSDLAAHAAAISAVPVCARVEGGIAVVGSPPIAQSVARSVLIRLAVRCTPDAYLIEQVGADEDWAWLAELPHDLRTAPRRGRLLHFRFVEKDAHPPTSQIFVVIATSVDEIPAGVSTVVDLSGVPTAYGPGWEGHGLGAVDRLSVAEARRESRAVMQWARREGLVGVSDALPSHLGFAVLEHQGALGTLAATIGIGAMGPTSIDLVEHGPHAIVGGTTGSGKSELLITWVLAIAARHDPSAVSFLLVDFKGGASFGLLESLPHCVGVITDLDDQGSRRAFESLAAELRFRERFLAAEGCRSIEELAPGLLARLVIVVDEFAAVSAGLPDLRDLFGDLAARGRSLGIHLVLCTQRPSGVVRENVLANCTLRLSLRVNNRADSTAVIGTDAAALLTPSARGRVFVAGIDAEPHASQLALASADDIAVVIERWRDAPTPRRPWLDPLPDQVSLEMLTAIPGDTGGTSRIFGRVDRPDEQAQPVAIWLPETHGNLLVIGGSRSGKTTALATLAQLDSTWVGAHDPSGAWDVLEVAVASSEPKIIVIDDLDVLVGRFGDEHQHEFVNRLQSLLREGPSRGIYLVASAQRITSGLGALAALLPGRLVLRLADRNEHVLAGASGSTFHDALPPGRGLWLGHRVQVATSDHRFSAPIPANPEPLVLGNTGTLFVVSTRPHEVCERLAAAFSAAVISRVSQQPPGAVEISRGSETRILVGDPDDWQARWGALTAVRETIPIMIDGCTVADYRALTRDRQLPPPLAHPASFWLIEPRCAPRRARLPDPPESANTPEPS
ncbi:MAG: FtsK/SpoIIIE domain-containing protein [Microbacteriaceae bacterium]